MLLEKVISIMAVTASLLDGGMDAAMPDKNIDGTAFLVNRQHVISELYVPEVRKTDLYGMSQSMREDAATALEELFAAAKEEAGYSLSTVSGYRSYSKQATIYARKKANTGSAEKADQLVAKAGTSEHQLGLAVDLVDANMQDLTSAQESTETQKWLMANSWRYGFIHRYPNGKTDITGIIYEPWHYRYVGKAAAQEIFNRDITLEEYLGKTEH